ILQHRQHIHKRPSSSLRPTVCMHAGSRNNTYTTVVHPCIMLWLCAFEKDRFKTSGAECHKYANHDILDCSNVSCFNPPTHHRIHSYLTTHRAKCIGGDQSKQLPR
ncbi:hypothetical protein TSMEX_001642, partial [Taenia solium]